MTDLPENVTRLMAVGLSAASSLTLTCVGGSLFSGYSFGLLQIKHSLHSNNNYILVLGDILWNHW